MIDEVRFERVIDASPDVVFEAFTTDGGQQAFYAFKLEGLPVPSEEAVAGELGAAPPRPTL